jgi:hypothetical protein
VEGDGIRINASVTGSIVNHNYVLNPGGVNFNDLGTGTSKVQPLVTELGSDISDTLTNLRNDVDDKASSDILDNASVGSLNAPGTNIVLSAFDNLVLRKSSSHVAESLEGGSVVIDWDEAGIKAITATNALAMSDDNRPTGALWMTGYGSITNSTESAIAASWPTDWTPVSGIDLVEIESERFVMFSYTWNGSRVLYSYETRETDPLPDAFGGTGRSSLTENKVLAGAGTGPVQLLSVTKGASVTGGELLGWDAHVTMLHTNDTPTKLWEIAVPTNTSFHGFADILSSGAAGGMMRHTAYGGFWRDGDAGLDHSYTNTVSHGEAGGKAYWYTNDNSAALYVVGVDSYNWRSSAGVRYELLSNPDEPPVPYTVLWKDSFEGVGSEESYGFVSGAAWDFDNTTQQFYGAESAYYTNNAARGYIITDYSGSSTTLSMRMSIRINKYPTTVSYGLRLFAIRNATSNDIGQVRVGTDGALEVRSVVRQADTFDRLDDDYEVAA